MENGAYLQMKAVGLEHTLGTIFNLGLKEEYVIASAGDIRKSPYMWMTVMLMAKYSDLNIIKKQLIKDFINEYYDCVNKTMDVIGRTKVDEMIKQFKNIMKIIKG